MRGGRSFAHGEHTLLCLHTCKNAGSSFHLSSKDATGLVRSSDTPPPPPAFSPANEAPLDFIEAQREASSAPGPPLESFKACVARSHPRDSPLVRMMQ